MSRPLAANCVKSVLKGGWEEGTEGPDLAGLPTCRREGTERALTAGVTAQREAGALRVMRTRQSGSIAW